MAKTYLHNPATSAASDQDWVNDVTDIAKNMLQWDGNSLTPKANNVIINRQPGHGLLVDTVNPTYPWADLLGSVTIDEAAASNKPSFTLIGKGNIKAYRFIIADQTYHRYHIPHDYLPGSDIFIHTHWMVNTADAGTVTFSYEHTYAAGHGVGVYPDAKTTTVTDTFTGAYNHMIAETQLSVAGGNTNLMDSNLLTPDGIIMVRHSLSAKTTTTNPFVFYVDIHYQSTGIGTKEKAPNFYGV